MTIQSTKQYTMNSKRIAELVKQATKEKHGDDPDYLEAYFDPEKFSELLVKECDQVIVSRSPGKIAEDGWVNGYNDGLLTAAFLIKKHFGVE